MQLYLHICLVDNNNSIVFFLSLSDFKVTFISSAVPCDACAYIGKVITTLPSKYIDISPKSIQIRKIIKPLTTQTIFRTLIASGPLRREFCETQPGGAHPSLNKKTCTLSLCKHNCINRELVNFCIYHIIQIAQRKRDFALLFFLFNGRRAVL